MASAKASVATRRRARVNLLPFFLLLPVMVVFLAVFAPAVIHIFLQSLWKFDSFRLAIVRDLTAANYVKFFTDAYYLNVLWLTIRISLIVTGISLVIGYCLAYFIFYRGGRFRTYYVLILLSPLLVTVVVRAFGWLLFLGDNGLLAQFLKFVLRTDSPPRVIFNEQGVILGLFHVYLPFMVLAILGSLQRIDISLPMAARNLGASAYQAFTRVTLPLSLPGVFTGSVLVFVLTMGSFAVPFLLGGGKVPMIAMQVYEKELVFINWPFAGAMGFILLAIVGTVIIFSGRALERGKYGVVFQ
ncbi:MAG: ABC transporter permease [Chloroflexi bacterium]|nr:ABC transporter permease [Chloroflexota bacterium]